MILKFVEIADNKNIRNIFLITDKKNVLADKLYTSFSG